MWVLTKFRNPSTSFAVLCAVPSLLGPLSFTNALADDCRRGAAALGLLSTAPLAPLPLPLPFSLPTPPKLSRALALCSRLGTAFCCNTLGVPLRDDTTDGGRRIDDAADPGRRERVDGLLVAGFGWACVRPLTGGEGRGGGILLPA